MPGLRERSLFLTAVHLAFLFVELPLQIFDFLAQFFFGALSHGDFFRSRLIGFGISHQMLEYGLDKFHSDSTASSRSSSSKSRS
jgi:hypothetical protein